MTLIHSRSALIGFLLTLPFIILNIVVGLRLDPVYSFMANIGLLGPTPWFPTLLVALFPIAGFIAMRPMLNAGPDGKRTFYIVNVLIAMFALGAAAFLWGALGEDIIKCNVLKIPNCD
jgi:hypothetical protein